MIHQAPTPRTIGAVNWLGLWTLYRKEVRRFLKVDKLSTALGTDDGAPREYRFGYGVLDENLNGQVDAGEKRIYFEIGGFSTYVFFDNPR